MRYRYVPRGDYYIGPKEGPDDTGEVEMPEVDDFRGRLEDLAMDVGLDPDQPGVRKAIEHLIDILTDHLENRPWEEVRDPHD